MTVLVSILQLHIKFYLTNLNEAFCFGSLCMMGSPLSQRRSHLESVMFIDPLTVHLTEWIVAYEMYVEIAYCLSQTAFFMIWLNFVSNLI